MPQLINIWQKNKYLKRKSLNKSIKRLAGALSVFLQTNKQKKRKYKCKLRVILLTAEEGGWHFSFVCYKRKGETLHLLNLSHMMVNSEIRGSSLSCPLCSWLFLQYLWKMRLAKEPWAILCWISRCVAAQAHRETEVQLAILTSCIQPSALQCLANHISFLFKYSASVWAEFPLFFPPSLSVCYQLKTHHKWCQCFHKGILLSKSATFASLAILLFF